MIYSNTPNIVDVTTIMSAVQGVDLVSEMEACFLSYSEGRTRVSSVGELLFDAPPGEVHVKSGHIIGSEYFVVKVASGFYANPELGLPSSSGVVLLFSVKTGMLCSILLDEGRLTDERTAAAGAVAAKYLAPLDPLRIGILGAGIQAERQLDHLRSVTTCREVSVWARRRGAAEQFARKAMTLGFSVNVESSPERVADACRLIVTTTPSKEPLISLSDIRPGTHITAIGSDTPDKAELSDDLLSAANIIAVDSLVQCRERGESRRLLADAKIIELGAVIAGREKGRTSRDDITIADLTGLAVQDAAIAEAVLREIIAA